MRGITKTYKKEIELSEIDILLNQTIHKDWYDGDIDARVKITKTRKGDWEGEAIPVNIDDVIKTMEQLKKSGSNYCEIMYHSDHNGYVFNGMEIRKSTEAEIKKHAKGEAKRKKIEKQMRELQKQYEKKQEALLKQSS